MTPQSTVADILERVRAAFGNPLSSLRDRARSGLAASRFNQAQGVLDSLTGTNADIGFFHRDDGSKVYNCSIRLLSGSLAYGTGTTLEEAYQAAHTNAPIRKQVSS